MDGEAYDESVRALGTDDLFRYFDALGEPFLWIVDAVPGRPTAREIAATAAPHPLGHTLFTLRSRSYDGLGTPVDLGPLDPPHARLLAGDDALAEAMDGHPWPSACSGGRSAPATARRSSTTGCTPGADPSSTRSRETT